MKEELCEAFRCKEKAVGSVVVNGEVFSYLCRLHSLQVRAFLNEISEPEIKEASVTGILTKDGCSDIDDNNIIAFDGGGNLKKVKK